MIRHAGLLAFHDAFGWRGVLVEGPSGCGKSDLALRAIESGWRMVADDRTLVWASSGGLYGRAPDPLAGLIEVRGVGVIVQPAKRFVQICLLARCMQVKDVERSPETAFETVLEVAIPRVHLAALEASAPAKLGHALTCIGLKPQPAYLALRASRSPPGVGGVP